MADLLATVADVVWTPMAYVVLTLGVVFSVSTKFVQFRCIPDMLRQLRKTGDAEGGLTSFQALVLALASRVGVGSIAGVATAIAGGGPGALLWMAATGLLGCTVGYAEATLSQVFKRQVEDEDRRRAGEDVGGMPYYIRFGLGTPRLAALVAVLGLVGYGFVFPGFQVSTIAGSAELAFGLPGWVPAVAVTVMMAVVIFGGTTRIVRVTQTLVPVLAVGYLALAVAVFLFGFTCLLLYFYVANSNLLFLLDGRQSRAADLGLRLGTLAIVFFGAVVNAGVVWSLGDIGLGLITWINLFCLARLAPWSGASAATTTSDDAAPRTPPSIHDRWASRAPTSGCGTRSRRLSNDDHPPRERPCHDHAHRSTGTRSRRLSPAGPGTRHRWGGHHRVGR